MSVKRKKIAVTVDTGFSGGYYNEVVEVSYESDEDPIKEEDNFHRAVHMMCHDIIMENIGSEYEVIEDAEVAERLSGTYWGDASNLEPAIEDIKQDIADEEDTDEPM